MSDDDNVQIATPVVSIETIAKVTRGLFSIKKPADYKDLASPVGLHKVTVSQGLSAAEALGLADTPSRGTYVLTDTGEKFARLLGFGKEEECRRLIASQILELPSWSEIVTFLEINRRNARDPLDLVLHVEQRLGKRWMNRMRGKIGSSYRSILEYANLIRMEDNMIVSLLPDENDAIPESESESPLYEQISTKKNVDSRFESLMTSRIGRNDYFQFGMPEFFIIMVKKKTSSVEYLRKQLKSDSIISSWLDEVENELRAEDSIDE